MRKPGARIIAAILLSTISAGTANAEASSGFTFKRVTPPTKGAGKLINIHVEPKAPVAPVLSNIPDLPTAPDIVRPRGTAPAGTAAGWFWAVLSPDLSAASPTRMSQAMQVVGRDANAPRAPVLDQMADLANRYGAEILTSTAGTQVSPALVLAVIAVESGGAPKAQSHAGAVGLMQLMPGTASRFGVRDRTNPAQNIDGGVKYLSFLLDEFGGDPLLTLAAYNAGEGAVRKNGGVPNYAETREYVPKVVAAWTQARLLCVTPPMRATDGCLFAGLRVASQ